MGWKADDHSGHSTTANRHAMTVDRKRHRPKAGTALPEPGLCTTEADRIGL
jgi:hypothetical protein